MADFRDSLTPPGTHPRPVAVREDCWSEEASSTLVDAWGRRYPDLNHGNLRQKDWQNVADLVNAFHGHTKKSYRTDVQCKNRIDTIKKKYKVEKARVSFSDRALASTWPFLERLDALIGSNFSAKKSSQSQSQSPPVALPLPFRKTPSPATAVVLPQKRSSATGLDDGYFWSNYSAVAAAAAAVTVDEEEEEEVEVGRRRRKMKGGEARWLKRRGRGKG